VRVLIFAVCALLVASTARAELHNNMDADAVIGQPDFTTRAAATSQTGLRTPMRVFCDGQRLFIAEFGNNRVVVFNTIPTTNNASADVVIGQSDFTSGGFNLMRNTLRNPTGVASDGRWLFIVDYNNNRVLIYNIAGSSPMKLGPQFDQGKAVLGKVFDDINGNGRQDEGDAGIEGVKVASDTGIYAITDSDGKYHFPYIETGQRLLKIDESTLPEGSEITTDNPYKVTVTKGILSKVSFGVKLPPEPANPRTKEPIGSPLLKVSVSQDPVLLKPKLSISHKIITHDARPFDFAQGRRTTHDEKVEFSIACNYFLFIDKARIDIYDSDMKLVKSIDLPKPLPSKYTIPITDLTGKTDQTLYYQLTVYDKSGKKDRTGVGMIEMEKS
jgi:hypothetical protein